ncbi:MAG: flagellar basal body P-ring protein FlgI [Arcobacteraceae bacterium]|nr:flagellar basal body P-ring protein FlgI [Arcobacteraceae bacterium]
MKKIILICILTNLIYAQTIKDISNIVGIRDNQLIGYGLVVGLAGTGDKSQFTMQSLQNLLRNSYIKIPAASIKSKNVATVMVTAILPPFSRQGDKIKIEISSIGDAKSIDKGKLLLTQLKGIDGQVYAIGQGKVIGTTDNPTTGYIYDGANIENELDFAIKDEKNLTISLIKQDAKNASIVEKKINEKFKLNIAQAIDTRTIQVNRPINISMVSFIATIQDIQIDSNFRKKIIIDISKGLIVAGADIIVHPVTVTRKDFTLRIKNIKVTDDQWDNPATNKGKDIGDDVRIGNKPVEINLNNALINTKGLPTVSDLMRAMKVMKLDIQDIIETIQTLKELGAIEAQIETVR